MGLDELTVRCEPASAGADRAALAARAGQALQGETGLSVRVELLDPGTVPRSEGKAVRVEADQVLMAVGRGANTEPGP